MTEMSYTGTVHPGGRPDVRELPKLMINKLSVSEMDNNVYLLRCRQTDDQLLIDAADDAATILGTVGSDGLVRVVTTHRHGDHWQGTGGERQAVAAQEPLELLVERGDAVVVETRRGGAEDRHLLPGGAERLTVAD